MSSSQGKLLIIHGSNGFKLTELDEDHGLSVVPTKEWQDQLSKHLTSSSDASDAEPRTTRRRRLDLLPNDSSPRPDWKELYTLEGGMKFVFDDKAWS